MTCSSLQVNWQMLWASKHKRATIRWLGYLVLAFAVLFPVGIFTGAHQEPFPSPKAPAETLSVHSCCHGMHAVPAPTITTHGHRKGFLIKHSS